MVFYELGYYLKFRGCGVRDAVYKDGFARYLDGFAQNIFELEAAAAALVPASLTTLTHSLSLFLVFLVLSRSPTHSLSFSI